jgi:hypothetical protein
MTDSPKRVLKDIRRSLKMISTLVRRGAWKGVRRFSYALAYGMTHRKCKRCQKVKGLNAHSFCYECQWTNLKRSLEEELIKW